MIPSPETVGMVIDALNESGAPYIITGSIASNAYGQPRATIDADFVVNASHDALEAIFRRMSATLRRDPQVAFESVTGKVQHKFRHPETAFAIEVFEANMNDPHEQSRFARRRPETLMGKPTYFPTAEDVIVGKLRWLKRINRAKDRNDLLLVLKRQWDTLDWAYIRRWCGEHTSLSLLEALATEVRPPS